MKKRSNQLDRITWDQATMLRLATLQGFKAFGLNPAILRQWSATGYIHPVAKAPGGAFLYHMPTVLAAKKWLDTRRDTNE